MAREVDQHPADPLIRYVPTSADVYRRVAELLDPETRFQFDCYLFLLLRNIDRGRLDVAKRSVELLRACLGCGRLAPPAEAAERLGLGDGQCSGHTAAAAAASSSTRPS